jgi:ATPase family AAA domain-containing protein 2
MCLSQMMSKIDRQEYKTKQDFLNDIKLIMSNALEYNPDRNMEGTEATVSSRFE